MVGVVGHASVGFSSVEWVREDVSAGEVSCVWVVTLAVDGSLGAVGVARLEGVVFGKGVNLICWDGCIVHTSYSVSHVSGF